MKKMDRLAEVKTIYAQLSKAEKELLHAQLKGFEEIGVRGYEHIYKVLIEIDRNPRASRKEILSSADVSSMTTGEFNALILRMKGYLLEHLHLDVNIERPGVYNNRFRTEVSNGKKIDQARILMDRGINGQGRKLLEEVVSRSEKYELFDQMTAALKLLGFSYSTEKGLRTYKRYEGYIKEAKAKSDAYDRATEIYAALRMNEARAGAGPDDTDYEKTAEELEKISKNFGLLYPSYLALTLKTENHSRRSEFRKAENACIKLTETIRAQAAAAQSEQRLSIALLKLAEIQLQLRKFEATEQTLNELRKILKRNSFESYLVNKYNCLVHFYSGNIELLNVELPKILKSKYTLRLPYASVLFHFYLGVNQFISGNYKGSLKILSDETDIDQSVDTDTAIGQNLFLFMSAAELIGNGEAEVSEQAEKALKNLETIYETATLRKRDKIIIRLMKRIKSQEFDFKKTAGLVKDSVKRLDNADPELRWEPISYEIVPIDRWFKSKSSGRKLKLKVPPAPKPEKK